MALTIEKLNPENLKDVNTCNGEFVIDARLAISVEDGAIRYTYVECAPARKRYAIEPLDYAGYLDDPEKDIFLAYVDGRLAGQLVLRKYWNHYAYIDDLCVDAAFRRQGIGRELISKAVSWARERRLAGLTLETQDNNPAACKFYARCGFRLGGFDRYLYHGLNSETEEIALYWYLLFDGGAQDGTR